MADFDRALELVPGDALAHLGRADAWALLGEFEKARLEAEDAERFGASIDPAWFDEIRRLQER